MTTLFITLFCQYIRQQGLTRDLLPFSYRRRAVVPSFRPVSDRRQTLADQTCLLAQDLYGNIVLSGGTSMFPGMADRMSKEVRPSLHIESV